MHISEVEMYHAINRMRQLTNAGVPFSFSYYKRDGSVKHVSRAVLRKGYTKKQSKKAHILIGYTDLVSEEARQFHRALLIEFNQIKVKR